MENAEKTSGVTRNTKFFSTKKNCENKKQSPDIFKHPIWLMKLAIQSVGKFPRERNLLMMISRFTSLWLFYSIPN